MRNTRAPHQLPEALILDLSVQEVVHAIFQASPRQCQGLPTLVQNHRALKSHLEGTASCGDQALGQRTCRGRNDHSQGGDMYAPVQSIEIQSIAHVQSIASRAQHPGHCEGSWGVFAMVQSTAGGGQDMLPLFKGKPEQLFDFRQGRLQNKECYQG